MSTATQTEFPKRPWLLQRLRLPPIGKSSLAEQIFGGHNLGLSKEAWKMTHNLFSLDYMGAAEYEFGIFPEVISGLLQRTDLTSFEIVVSPLEIKKLPWDIDYSFRRLPKPKREAAIRQFIGITPSKIYVICPEPWQDAAKKFLFDLIVADKNQVRDNPCLDRSLIKKLNSDIIGWLEETNGWIFFTHKGVFERAKKFFIDHIVEEGPIGPDEIIEAKAPTVGTIIETTRYHKDRFSAEITGEKGSFWLCKKLDGNESPCRIKKTTLEKGVLYKIIG